MCDIKDAQRFEELAKLQEAEKDYQNARRSYLEAASIYVLQAELRKNNQFIKSSFSTSVFTGGLHLHAQPAEKEGSEIRPSSKDEAYPKCTSLEASDFLDKANQCYQKSKEVIGDKFKEELTKLELAKRTIIELGENNPQDILTAIKSEVAE